MNVLLPRYKKIYVQRKMEEKRFRIGKIRSPWIERFSRSLVSENELNQYHIYSVCE